MPNDSRKMPVVTPELKFKVLGDVAKKAAKNYEKLDKKDDDEKADGLIKKI
jgi:hypothetical protein